MDHEHAEKLKVMVTFIGSGKPFSDDDADRSETVGHLKQRVLAYFGLTEGQDQSGNNYLYTLYDNKTPLEDMNQRIGDVAGERKVLNLKLSQQITQGHGR